MNTVYKLLKALWWLTRKFIAFWLGALFTILFLVFIVIWEKVTYTPETCEAIPQEMAHYLIKRKLEKSEGFPHEIPTYIFEKHDKDKSSMWGYSFIFPSNPHKLVTAFIGCDTSIEFSFEDLK